MVKFVQDLGKPNGTRGSSRRGRGRLMDARTGGRFTRDLIDMYVAIDGGDFLEAAMRVIQAAAPGFMVSSKCHFLGVRGFRVNGDGVVDVDSETIGRCYREHPGLRLLAAHSGTRIVQSGSVASGLAAASHVPAATLCVPGEECHHHAVSLCFWEKPTGGTLDCVLSIHRGETEEPFNQVELESLQGLHPQIDRARRRVRGIEADRSALNSLEVLVRKLPLATLVLDWELQPVFANAAGRECCVRWTSGTNASGLKLARETPVVPGDLRDICHQMKCEWNDQAQPKNPLEQAVLRELAHATDEGRVARISMIPLGGTHPGRPSFLLQFLGPAETGTSGPMSGVSLAILAELTPEERAVAHQICDGKSNDEISTALGKSVFTVKRHIYSIFRKLQISNRTQLATRLLA